MLSSFFGSRDNSPTDTVKLTASRSGEAKIDLKDNKEEKKPEYVPGSKLSKEEVLAILAAFRRYDVFKPEEKKESKDSKEEKKSQPIRFYAFGCAGNEDPTFQKKVAKKMEDDARKSKEEGRPISFALNTGDNFYPDGTDHVNDEKFKNRYENKEFYGNLGIPVVTLAGNHDYKISSHDFKKGHMEYKKIGSQVLHTFVKDGKVDPELLKSLTEEKLDLSKLPTLFMPSLNFAVRLHPKVYLLCLDTNSLKREYVRLRRKEKGETKKTIDPTQDELPINQAEELREVLKTIPADATVIVAGHHGDVTKGKRSDHSESKKDDKGQYLDDEDIEYLKNEEKLSGNNNFLTGEILKKLGLNPHLRLCAHDHFGLFLFDQEKQISQCTLGNGGGFPQMLEDFTEPEKVLYFDRGNRPKSYATLAKFLSAFGADQYMPNEVTDGESEEKFGGYGYAEITVDPDAVELEQKVVVEFRNIVGGRYRFSATTGAILRDGKDEPAELIQYRNVVMARCDAYLKSGKINGWDKVSISARDTLFLIKRFFSEATSKTITQYREFVFDSLKAYAKIFKDNKPGMIIAAALEEQLITPLTPSPNRTKTPPAADTKEVKKAEIKSNDTETTATELTTVPDVSTTARLSKVLHGGLRGGSREAIESDVATDSDTVFVPRSKAMTIEQPHLRTASSSEETKNDRNGSRMFMTPEAFKHRIQSAMSSSPVLQNQHLKSTAGPSS